jgi:hypothetical protein
MSCRLPRLHVGHDISCLLSCRPSLHMTSNYIVPLPSNKATGCMTEFRHSDEQL